MMLFIHEISVVSQSHHSPGSRYDGCSTSTPHFWSQDSFNHVFLIIFHGVKNWHGSHIGDSYSKAEGTYGICCHVFPNAISFCPVVFVQWAALF